MSVAVADRPGLTQRQLEALAAMQLEPAKQAPAFARIPASIYLDPARYDLEMERIFFCAPTPVAPSALLPNPKSFRRLDFLNVPILLTRDREGVARAFVNVCRHRGTILCPEEGAQTGSRVICPYHAWTYALDGRLVGAPRSELFVDLDMADYGLTPLPCLEAGGLIWVGLRHDQPVDFTDVTDLARELDGLRMGEQYIYDQRTYELKCNWKLPMDGMLDSYHVTRLHRDTVGRYFSEMPNVLNMVGPHVMTASGRGNFDGTTSADFDAIRRRMVFSYVIFPNAIVILSPDYINLGIVKPIAVDRCKIDYYLLVEKGAQVAEERLKKSFDLMDVVFGKEDFWVAELGQEGMAAGTLKEIVLGGQEIQMKMFHDVVEQRVAAG